MKTYPFEIGDGSKHLLEQIHPLVLCYRRGQIIHALGETCNVLDFILSGTVEVFSLAENGGELVVFEHSAGHRIGANILFCENNIYPRGIRCGEDCQIFRLIRQDIEILMHDYTFAMSFVRSLSFNSGRLYAKMYSQIQKTLRQNLMDYFISLSHVQQSDVITLPISKKRLADLFSVQRPSLFRELKKMKEEGLIAIDGDRITLFFALPVQD